MSQEIRSDDLPESAERGVWVAPTLVRLDTEEAEGAPIGVGADFGIYS